MSAAPQADIARIFREESGRVIAGLVRRFGDIDVAEEAVQDAFMIATDRWTRDGLPPNPGGWIATTARNRALDRVRREAGRSRRSIAAMNLYSNEPGEPDRFGDDRLRLIFTCCHPALEPSAQVALTLRLLGGLQTHEIARAFLVPETTLAQRIVRAKKRISANHIPYRVPEPHELPDRLPPVLAVVYLIFNEGHTATDADTLVRRELCEEAIRLARLLAALMPDEPEVLGLLALTLLIHTRASTRVDTQGTLVRLADQDRSRWDADMIAEGHDLVRQCLRRNQPGPYQFQAAINAVHTDAPSGAATDWSQILALYDQYVAMDPSPIVALNRAIAVGEHHGPAAGLRELDALDLDNYPYFHAARGEFLHRLGDSNEARTALRRAIDLTSNPSERAHLHRQLER
ncbi:MAG: RNA polymerase sigma factor [Acidimicrobiia bacterium]